MWSTPSGLPASMVSSSPSAVAATPWRVTRAAMAAWSSISRGCAAWRSIRTPASRAYRAERCGATSIARRRPSVSSCPVASSRKQAWRGSRSVAARAGSVASMASRSTAFSRPGSSARTGPCARRRRSQSPICSGRSAAAAGTSASSRRSSFAPIRSGRSSRSPAFSMRSPMHRRSSPDGATSVWMHPTRSRRLRWRSPCRRPRTCPRRFTTGPA